VGMLELGKRTRYALLGGANGIRLLPRPRDYGATGPMRLMGFAKQNASAQAGAFCS